MPGNYGNKKKKNKKVQKPPAGGKNEQKPASASAQSSTAKAQPHSNIPCCAHQQKSPALQAHKECCSNNNNKDNSSGFHFAKATRQFPPIVAVSAKCIPDYRGFLAHVTKTLGLGKCELMIKLTSETHRFCLTNKRHFNMLIKYLVDRKIQYFTYTPKDDKPFSYVVKGLPTSLGEMAVKLAFVAMKFNVIKLKKISKTVWFLQLKSKGTTGNITKVTEILGNKVQIEKFKRTFIIQCRNCQRLGHTAFNCCFEYRCVKCSESHDPGKCLIPKRKVENKGKAPEKSTLLKCALCGEGHAANYKYCSYKENYVEKNKLEIERKLLHEQICEEISRRAQELDG